MNAVAPATSHENTRARIVEAAASLLASDGRAAVTTRAVATRVGVSPPTIFRLFGEKNGLLAAVAEYGYERFYAAKGSLRPTDDPVGDLRSAWSLTVEFGLESPELFLLIYGEPHSEEMAAAVADGTERMRARIQRVAAAGRMRVDEALAADLLQSTARGAVLQCLDQPVSRLRTELVHAVCDATMAAITTEAALTSESGLAGAARTLRANLQGQHVLSPAEEQLLRDWLERLGG